MTFRFPRINFPRFALEAHFLKLDFKNPSEKMKTPIIKTNCVISLIIFLIFQGNNALHYAVSFRNWKIVDVLLGTGSMNLNLPNKVLFLS